MIANASSVLQSVSSEATMQIAKEFACDLPIPFRFYLSGELGCGKTTFVRGLLCGFAAIEQVRSPTFALVEIYQVHNHRIAHMDFYRCRYGSEWLDAGLSETIDQTDLCLIEWPEKAIDLPQPDIHLIIEDGESEQQRKLAFNAYTRQGKKCLARV